MLGRRVSESERQQVFERLAAVTSENGIALIVIHPAYLRSRPHQCLLTRFCAEARVPMLAAYPALHPPKRPRDAFFVDSWHPNAEGHHRLAIALAELIQERRLLDY